MNNIYFTGFMGTGKTTVSKKLCELTGAKWIDTDEEIEKEEGRKISDIFAADGEEYFRKAETAILKKIAASKDRLVVSCGGGLVLKDENINIMKESGSVVFLSALPETIFEHVKYSHNRPVLEGNMNVEFIRELLEKRLPFYEKAADFRVECDGKSVKEITAEVRGNYFT
ncbi:MAG: shikimate kinase [Eubacterium sp.]|nr:shikimate kinase [Eubacterium sp.]